jgi:hypothetical protein
VSVSSTQLYGAVRLRKISIFCRLSGTLCPAIFAVFAAMFIARPSALAQTILLENPKPAPTPPPSSSGREGFKQKKQREIREETQRISADATRAREATDQIRFNAIKDSQFGAFVDISLYAGQAVVSHGRSNYMVEPGSHVSGYVRPFWRIGITETQPWFGLRVAPFGGHGTQSGRSGRYAHTWLGPSLGVGKFLTLNDREKAAIPEYFLLLSGGFAALTKLRHPTEAEKSPADDFRPCGWCQDASGAWLEMRLTHLGLGLVGFGGHLGIQTGSGKKFTYLGGNISFFY